MSKLTPADAAEVAFDVEGDAEAEEAELAATASITSGFLVPGVRFMPPFVASSSLALSSRVSVCMSVSHSVAVRPCVMLMEEPQGRVQYCDRRHKARWRAIRMR